MAGIGATASLLAAIAAAALIAPGIIGFHGWSLAPSPPAGGSVRVQPTESPDAARGAAVPRAPARIVVPSVADPGRTGAGDGGPSRGGGRDVATPGDGSGSSPARPAAAAGSGPAAGCVCPVGVNESLARSAEGTGTAVASGIHRLGASTGGTVSLVNPTLGHELRRGGAAAGEGVGRIGTAAGDVLRRLPGSEAAPQPLTLVRGALR